VSMHEHISSRKRFWAAGLRLLTAGLLGVAAAAVLVSCGSSGKGLIPLANAGPLQSDFEAVAQAAQTGGGNCTATTEAINKTERDFAALPATIDAGLHSRLSQGISNLRERALALCAQPLVQTSTTTTPRTTTTTKTQPTPAPTTPTTTTSTSTAPTAPSTPTPPSNGGGTVAPGSESPPGVGPGGGTGAGEAGEAGNAGGGIGEAGAGGQGSGNGRGQGKGNGQ
jgi:hypothetical protein